MVVRDRSDGITKRKQGLPDTAVFRNIWTPRGWDNIHKTHKVYSPSSERGKGHSISSLTKSCSKLIPGGAGKISFLFLTITIYLSHIVGQVSWPGLFLKHKADFMIFYWVNSVLCLVSVSDLCLFFLIVLHTHTTHTHAHTEIWSQEVGKASRCGSESIWSGKSK